MRFRLRALDARHRVVSLELHALDEHSARAQAESAGLRPLSLRRTAAPRGAAFDLPLFAQELQALLEAGLALAEALETLAEHQPPSARRLVLERLLLRLQEGWRLSQALREQPQAFPPLFVGLVASAEGSGDTAQALGRYIAYAERVGGLRQKLLSAAIYPAILLAAGAAVAAFLLGWVVPRFAAVHADSGRELPWASALLMAWGRWAGEHASALGWSLGAAALAAALLLRRLRRRGLGRAWARWVPGAAAVVHRMALSRIYLTLGTLIESGFPVPAALAACEAAGAGPMGDRLRAACADVRAGHPLSAALDAQGLCTPVALRLLRVAERSGRLGPLLCRAAAFHDDETARWIERFARSFEPLLMAVIGAVIGLIVLLLYMPVFELAGAWP